MGRRARRGHRVAGEIENSKISEETKTVLERTLNCTAGTDLGHPAIRRILPAGEYGPSGNLEPEKAPHARHVDPRQDDLPTRIKDPLLRSLKIFDQYVIQAHRWLLRVGSPHTSHRSARSFVSK